LKGLAKQDGVVLHWRLLVNHDVWLPEELQIVPVKHNTWKLTPDLTSNYILLKLAMYTSEKFIV